MIVGNSIMHVEARGDVVKVVTCYAIMVNDVGLCDMMVGCCELL